MIHNLSIQTKMIIGVIFFTLLVVGLERYQFSENIVEQFIASKKSKNQLLVDTISPIIGLNISLGLNDANQEYLDQIVKQNSDLENLELIDFNGRLVYSYNKQKKKTATKDIDKTDFCTKKIYDPVTGENSGRVSIYFDNHEYQMILEKNKNTTFKIFIMTSILLILYILLIKREFKFLKELAASVLRYDPKLNNLILKKSDRSDEAGVIHNAIIEMVGKIESHAKLLDNINQSLEQKINERTKELEEANIQLKQLSITDSLTELSNRRHFENHLSNIWQLAKRSGISITAIMCDIDHFKMVNDKFGHIVGDSVLKGVAQVLNTSLERNSDFIARYGGEEFVILLYDAETDAAKELCIKIQNKLKNIGGFKHEETETNAITLSFGICSVVPSESDKEEDLIKKADSALYQAKKSGRNCIVAL